MLKYLYDIVWFFSFENTVIDLEQIQYPLGPLVVLLLTNFCLVVCGADKWNAVKVKFNEQKTKGLEQAKDDTALGDTLSSCTRIQFMVLLLALIDLRPL
jgi:hypothetical protein